ncbi:MAG: GNAT family N-acetyltransferase [Candidatus Eremiobacteraeota bacterium]|nr:GNAT family N-acetyltransferase [Candidatus Eremiobacteraeota bacterium]
MHVTSWNETYRGIMPDDLIDARTVDVRKRQWRESLTEPHRITFVAEDEAEIVGFASSFLLNPPVNGFDAYLQTVYLVEAVKGRGLGTALLRSTAAELVQHGCRNLVLRTLRQNPARRFYEHLGARLLPDGVLLDEDIFDDVVYAFDTLDDLL